MTDKVTESAGPMPTARRAEARAIAVIAVPLAGAYLAELAMSIVTKIVAGSIDHVALAASGLAEDLVIEIIVVLMGLLTVVGVMAAETEGVRDSEATAHRVRQGFLVATLIGLPTTFLVWHLGLLLPYLGQAPEVTAAATPYMKALAPMVLPVLWFAVLRNFAAAIGRTRPVLVITLLAVGLKIFLSYGLVLGYFGLPAVGLIGAALATSIANWFMFLAFLASVLFDKRLSHYRLWNDLLRLDQAICGEILRVGFPAALLVLLEGGLFVAVQVLMGLFGAESLAANQIVISWAAFAFVIVLGLSEATMVRVAHGSGRRDLHAARQAGLIGIALAVGIMAVLAVVPIFFPDWITGIFLKPDDPVLPEIRGLIGVLLVIAALFGIFDGLQAVASRALRGLRDTVVPLSLAALGYWGVGIGGGVALAFPLNLGEEGLWWGLAGGLMATGIALTWRFVALTGRPAQT